MGIGFSQAENLSTIQLDGEVDIAVAAELKAALLKALEAGGAISVSLGSATVIDVTAFQLLWAARREATRAGLKFAVTPELSEPIRSSLQCMGLAGLLVG